jgi:two-component system response regulator HydG
VPVQAKDTILVVDDDLAHRTMLKTLLSGWGYLIREADDGETAITAVRERPFDLILMDIRMLKVSGLEALVEIKALNPAIPVIIMTAYASLETAVDAVKKGAYDYLQKPLDFDELRVKMERAMEHRRLKEENALLKESLGSRFDRRNIIGSSPVMVRLLETVAQVAPAEATVLITGESGTGKEMIAGAIHFNSRRREGPFVKINCAAITETLLESELFGHERGAFTGADRRQEGKFRQADGGTIFLDEVSEMSLAMQVKLLRVLQEREIIRVGGSDTVKVDVRVIAATNRDLAAEIASGRFREDLYYRLNVVALTVPPLRERAEDIPILAQHFLEHFSRKNNKQIKGFSPQAMDRLRHYSWPGNVRELMNAVERGVVLSRGDYLEEAELSLVTAPGTVPAPAAADGANFLSAGGAAASMAVSGGGVTIPTALGAETPVGGNRPVSLEEMEKETIIRALAAAKGNKSEAARRLGVTRRTLHLKLKRYGLME